MQPPLQHAHCCKRRYIYLYKYGPLPIACRAWQHLRIGEKAPAQDACFADDYCVGARVRQHDCLDMICSSGRIWELCQCDYWHNCAQLSSYILQSAEALFTWKAVHKGCMCC